VIRAHQPCLVRTCPPRRTSRRYFSVSPTLSTGAQKDKRVCLRVGLDPPLLSLTVRARDSGGALLIHCAPCWTALRTEVIVCAAALSGVGESQLRASPVITLAKRWSRLPSLQVSSVDLGCEMVYPPESLVIFETSEEASFHRDCSMMHVACLVSLRCLDCACCPLTLPWPGTHRSALTIASR
jgi:hypothetical protein